MCLEFFYYLKSFKGYVLGLIYKKATSLFNQDKQSMLKKFKATKMFSAEVEDKCLPLPKAENMKYGFDSSHSSDSCLILNILESARFLPITYYVRA